MDFCGQCGLLLPPKVTMCPRCGFVVTPDRELEGHVAHNSTLISALDKTALSRRGRNDQMTGQRRGFVNGKGLLVIFLVLILMAGTAGLTYYLVRPLPQKTVGVTPTPVGTTSATSTAQPQPSNPYPPYTGTLALNDPLADNTRGYSWEEGTRDQGTCAFIEGTYHSNIPLTGYFHSCVVLSTHFSNFAFEVQMSLISGTAGGIVFNADRATTHFYSFTIDRNGAYFLRAYYDKVGGFTPLASGSGVSFNGTGLIGVVEQGTNISLYLNHQIVQQVNTAPAGQGQLGVVVYEGEAVFSNARAWVL